MAYENIPYKSYCWSLGTTSYRTKNFNHNIEKQLLLLDEFWESRKKHENWLGNDQLQSEYYDFLKANGFITGQASNKSKDAREKTSGLVDIGLITEERTLTDVGKALVKISRSQDFSSDNSFFVSKDSFIYFKQLLKTTCNVNGKPVRPFLVLIYLLDRLDYLTVEEYTYLLPLCIDEESTQRVLRWILEVRDGKQTIDEVILKNLKRLENYQRAEQLFLDQPVTEELLCTVGFNRKSRSYDKAYLPVYQLLYAVCMDGQTGRIKNFYDSLKQVKTGSYWRQYLFDTSSSKAIYLDPAKHFQPGEFSLAKTEEEFKRSFFWRMHLIKAKSTLYDYFDLNRRYTKNTDMVLFEDQMVQFDLIPKYFFVLSAQKLYQQAFEYSDKLMEDCALTDIHASLVFDEKKIIDEINRDRGTSITTMAEARALVEEERYRRFHHLLDTKFTDKVLIRLLEDIEKRRDKEITKTVTNNADVPTIFEYLLGIIWYQLSGRKGKILDYMKLSLEADLLPKTHAGGGEADIVYEYEEAEQYPEHTLLLEATLANAATQRSMEMEPVSRHLGQHLLKKPNPNSYCVFVSNHLDINVISDFRNRKTFQWFDRQDSEHMVDGMKIIPLQTSELKKIIQNKDQYAKLYTLFEEAFSADVPIPKWYDQEIAAKL